jgi:hypothetical protein
MSLGRLPTDWEIMVNGASCTSSPGRGIPERTVMQPREAGSGLISITIAWCGALHAGAAMMVNIKI